MSLNANGALKALCLISQAWGQRQRHVHTHAQTCREHPYYVTKSHMLPWERGRSGLAGRERKTRQSEGKYQINKEAAGRGVGLPTAPSHFWKHILPQRHIHLTGGHSGSCQVKTHLSLRPRTRHYGQVCTRQPSSWNTSLEKNPRKVNW